MFLISCETGGRRAPAQWIALTRQAAKESAEAPTALPRRMPSDASGRYAARRLAKNLGAPLVEHEYSLECVDVTRSPHHRNLFSERARQLSAEYRDRLMSEVYWPYRERLCREIRRGLRGGAYLIHLSVRTFAASSKGRMRRTDMGLLYDPVKQDELDFCLDWIDELWERTPMLRVRRNYPRRGMRDCLTRSLRQEFSDKNYVGIEVWLNRAWASRPLKIRDEVLDGLSDALVAIFDESEVEAA